MYLDDDDFEIESIEILATKAEELDTKVKQEDKFRKQQLRDEEQNKIRQAVLGAIIHQDIKALQKLHSLGLKTKLQLLGLGLKSSSIDLLEKRGILERTFNQTRNLWYYKVHDDVLREYSARFK